MVNLAIFAERLQDLMLENGMDVSRLTEIAQVNRSSVNRYLAGTRLPSVATLLRMASAFRCTCDFLLGIDSENYCSAFKEAPPFDVQIRYLLQKFDKTKYRLQKETGIAESAIYYWLNGSHAPRVDDVVKLAECFNCSVDHVLGRTN